MKIFNPKKDVEGKAIDSFKGEHEFLSNFWPCRIVYLGVAYPSVEHGFQAMKSLFVSERRRISRLNTASAAKQAGRRLKLRDDWEQVKEGIMYDLLWEKFINLWLKQKLLTTGNSMLIEGNTWGDRYWGVCNGVGENRLGQLLMRIRREIK